MLTLHHPNAIGTIYYPLVLSAAASVAGVEHGASADEGGDDASEAEDSDGAPQFDAHVLQQREELVDVTAALLGQEVLKQQVLKQYVLTQQALKLTGI